MALFVRNKRQLSALTRPLVFLFLWGSLFSCSPGGEQGPGVQGKGQDEAPPRDSEVMDAVELSAVDLSAFDRAREERARENRRQLRGTFDFSASTVNYFTAEDHDTSLFSLSSEAGPLEIIDYGPQGELPAEMRRPEIHIMFSQPMVPLSRLGAPLREMEFLSLDPPLEGVYRWYGSQLLSFQADKALTEDPDGFPRHFKVRVNRKITSLTGNSLKEDHTFSFHTEGLKMVSLVIPGAEPGTSLGRTRNVPFDLARQAIIRFNMPVEIDSLEEGLTVKVGSKETDYTLSHPEDESEKRRARSLLVTLPADTPFSNSQEITLQVAPGTRPRPNTPPTAQVLTRSYETLKSFTFRRQSTHSYAFPHSAQVNRYPLYLQFSQPIDPSQDLVALISTNLNTDLSDKVSVSGASLRISNLPVKPGETYQIFVEGDLRDVYGQNLSSGRVEVSATVPEPQAYIRFPDKYAGRSKWRRFSPRSGYLESQFNPGLITAHQNLENLSYGIASVDGMVDLTSSVPQKPKEMESYERNRSHYEYVDLAPYLNDEGKGTVRFEATAEYQNRWNDRLSRREDRLLVQVTDIGLTVRYGYNRIVVWANSLSRGTPVAGGDVKLYDRNRELRQTGTTDDQGLAVFDLPPGAYRRFYDEYYSSSESKSFWVSVEKGGDKAELEVLSRQDAGRSGVYPTSRAERAELVYHRVLLFSDRQLYKPGETVAYRGIHWEQYLGDYTPHQGEYSLTLQDLGSSSKIHYQTQGRTSESGGFFGTFPLPEDIKPGSYLLRYTAGQYRRSEIIKVAYFRRLNFSVSASVPDRIFFEGDTLSVPFKAEYLAGGALGGGSYHSYWTRRGIFYSPPGKKWDSYHFGLRQYSGERLLDREEGTLSASGEARIQQTAGDHESLGGTYRYTAEATVTDIDDQQVSARASVVVHPGSFYIGARFGNSGGSYWSRFIPANQKTRVSTVLVTPRGEVHTGGAEITASLSRITWKSTYQQGVYDRVNVRYHKTEEPLFVRSVTMGDDGFGELTLNPEKSGSYILRLIGTDAQGRAVRTELSFYVFGGGWYYRGGEEDRIALLPDRDLYFAGDTARLMVQSPLKEGRYLLTIEREGIREQKIITLDEEKSLVEIPIKEEYLPRIYVSLSSFSQRQEVPESYFDEDLGKPRGIFGAAALDVSPRTRELSLEVTTEKESFRPGEKARVKIRATRGGEPAADTELVFLAVDRGVLDLVNYHVPNPLKFFYSPSFFPLFTNGDDLRNYLMDPVTYDIAALQGGGGAKLEERKDFNPLAAFVPRLMTDSRGEAVVEFDLPDTLTTYRTTVLALKGDRAGYHEGEILVKNPVNVRTAFPRRLRLRDTGVGEVVLQNNQEEDQEISLSLSSEELSFPDESRKKVTVPAGGVYTVPFLMVSRGTAGTAEVRIRVESEALSEILVQKLEVERPLTVESFTVTGQADLPWPQDRADEVADPGKAAWAEEGLLLPENIAPGFGSCLIETYVSRLGMLKAPIRELRNYPVPGLASKLYRNMTDAVLGETKLQALELTFHQEETQKLIDALHQSQTSAGWIRYWTRQQYPSGYFDTLALQLASAAQASGFDVPPALTSGLTRSLFNYYSDEKVRPVSLAFGAFVLTRVGVDTQTFLDRLEGMEDELGLTGYAYASLALEAGGRKGAAQGMWNRAQKFVRLGTRTVDINEPYETRWYFDSEIQQMAALARASRALGDPPEIQQKFLTTLQQRLSEKGLWHSLGDYLFTVLAMNDFADDDEIDNLNLTARAFLADAPLGEARVTKLSDEPLIKEMPLFEGLLADQPRGELLPLRLEKEGTGNLYYNMRLQYALPGEIALPRDEGISVFLSYETLEGETVKPEEIEKGTTYRVRTVISSSRRRSYLTLDVPLPSGMEMVDPSFATTSHYADQGGTNSEEWTRETAYGDEYTFGAEGEARFQGGYWWFWKNEPEMEVYDNHVSYLWQTFYEGKRELTFLVRATSAGIYPTPPAQATLLTEPEVFGRSGGLLFVIQ